MEPDWQPHDRRLVLADGSTLEVTSPAAVAWDGGALVLRGAFGAGDDPTIELGVRHPIASAAHVWVPHLTPGDGDVIGDAVFRAPAIIVADAAVALAFVPDLDDVRDAVGWRAWLDYDHPKRT